MLEGSDTEDLTLAVDDVGCGAPQGELADGVGEAGLADRKTVAYQRIRRLSIGGERTSNGAPAFIWAKNLPTVPKASIALWPVSFSNSAAIFCIEAAKLAATATWTFGRSGVPRHAEERCADQQAR